MYDSPRWNDPRIDEAEYNEDQDEPFKGFRNRLEYEEFLQDEKVDRQIKFRKGE